MNKKGFTLIELLGVVVLLITIATITTMVVVGFVNNTNNTIDEGVKKLIFSAAERYIYDEIDLESDGNYIVSIQTLIDKNKLDNTFVESNEIEKTSCVRVKLTNGVAHYEISEVCN